MKKKFSPLYLPVPINDKIAAAPQVKDFSRIIKELMYKKSIL
jgi:hypothetical protein